MGWQEGYGGIIGIVVGWRLYGEDRVANVAGPDADPTRGGAAVLEIHLRQAGAYETAREGSRGQVEAGGFAGRSGQDAMAAWALDGADEAARRVLPDRSGVCGAGVAGVVCRTEAVSCCAYLAQGTAADQGGCALARPL